AQRSARGLLGPLVREPGPQRVPALVPAAHGARGLRRAHPPAARHPRAARAARQLLARVDDVARPARVHADVRAHSRGHERAAHPSILVGVLVALTAVVLGVRQPLPAAIVFGAAWALAANAVVTLRGFRAGWKHGVAYLGHLGVSVMLIGIVASSGYGNAVQ